MAEQKLNIKANGNFNNINLKDLEPNNYTVVAKKAHAGGIRKEGISKDPKKPGEKYNYYICIVEYEGKDVSFLLYEDDHINFESAGGAGDKVKVTCTLFKNKKGTYSQKFAFEKVL